MIRKTDFFIDGRWVAPTKPHDFEVINPADENPYAVISLGGEADLEQSRRRRPRRVSGVEPNRPR